MIPDAYAQLAATIAAGTGLDVSTDPSKVNPPCVVVDPPTVKASTAGAFTLESNVFLVAPQPAGAHSVGWLLEHVEAALTAVGEAVAEPTIYTPNATQTFPAYRITTTYTVRRTTA